MTTLSPDTLKATEQAIKPLWQYLLALGAEPDHLALLTQARALSCQPGECLLPQGEHQTFAYFVVDGIVRACHYTQEGSERCKEFYFEGELCFLYSSWLKQDVAPYQLETVGACRLVQIPLAVLNEPFMQQVQLALLKQQLLYKEQKEAFLLLNTPEQRYLHLFEYFPLWVERLTHAQLANYIGITAISLSRIRKRLQDSP
ncbi:Crp/Fnr family transcriptional regulator [Shewanella xiamenensis]|uniref:Crp/Fnr family transcriptional regulator n=1 Tax=Shewanella xiamenensis TaxID=332186 RepID=A0AAE4PYS7_9GAMM|nr:Crp/Fnr family transcriptional regulator [Shewanella xiamenensis]MDH1625267.1 Crp/Fnr family transcriptional regulator [Shewanella xiamenensis]MDV5248287.1 Crp/Fnr family transcriptional regulator [Shewanella xiamenensis]MDV5389538.1 Crp/Fnr family transcriptional regulator [Shewanella xiamenensis]